MSMLRHTPPHTPKTQNLPRTTQRPRRPLHPTPTVLSPSLPTFPLLHSRVVPSVVISLDVWC